MSLLRRIERHNEESPGDEPENRPPSIPRPAPIQELWHHVAEGKLFTVTMTCDSRFIIAGSQAGEVLFFDVAGRLLWKGKVAGAVNRLALAEDAECFLAGTISGGKGAYLWHYTGRLLHTFASESDTTGIAITPDANLTVIASADQHLYGFDRDGATLFDHTLEAPLLNLAITADGSMIVTGSDDHHVYAYDRAGNQRWAYQTGGRVWAGVRIAEQGRVLVAGSNDHSVYSLDFDGQERWKFDTGGPVNTLAVTPDGLFTAVGGQSNTVYVLNGEGNVLWEYQTGDHIYGLDFSPDGRFLVIGSNDSNLYLVDRQNGTRIWKHATRGRVYGAALAPGGQYFAAASADQNVYAFKNTLVEDDPAMLTRPDSKPLMKLIVQRVYEEYANAPHAGLVRWFNEFEKSLRSLQFDACQALLTAAEEERGFELSDGEKQYIRSLEGVYWLVRGVAFHRHSQYAEARACYERSKTLQESLNNQDGAGQVVAALSLLPDESTAEETELSDESRALLDEITTKPRVLGMSEKLLAQRLSTAPPGEQLQIILLAKQSGYISPLIKGLSAEERVIQAAASAALALLDPGPGYDVLVQMLEAPHLFVKWQALRMLRDRATHHADQFKEAKDQFWPMVISPSITGAPDPLTRREVALLAKDGGSEDDTSWLIEQLGDQDPDVQLAAADALGAVGNRQALPKLARVPNKSGFLGRDLGMAASEARNAIEARYPTPTIEQVILCDTDPLQRDAVQQSTLFLSSTSTVYGIVTVDHVKPGAQITVKWLDSDTVLKEEQCTVPDQPDTQRIAEIRETEIVDDAARPVRSPFGGRSPFGRDNTEEPRLGGFRRRLPSTQDEENDDDNPFAQGLGRRSPPVPPRPASPFQRREPAEPPQRPSFLRGRFDAPQPPDRLPRPRFGDGSGLRSRDAVRPGTSPALGTRPGSSPFGRSDSAPATRPGTESRRAIRVTDPNENIANNAPEETDSENERATSPFGSPAPLPGRFGRDQISPPRPGSSSEEAELPPWLRRQEVDDQEESSPFRRPPPFGADRPGFGRFGQPESPERPVSRRPRLGPSATAQQFVFALPCPSNGWKGNTYQIEVTLEETAAKHQTPFQFIEAIKLTGIEPGVTSQRADNFGKTSTFLISTQYVDCLVHLEKAPVNTRVTGRVYSVTTGTVIAETVAYTQKQGRQTLQLTWEHTTWQPGYYRIVAAAENSNEIGADIEFVTRIRADHIVLCHQVDKNNGPVGAQWPFRPGDQCYCVVSFNAPPPGIEVYATWYRQDESTPIVQQATPYITTVNADQHVVFRLGSRDQKVTLTPGHYSVIIEGKSLVREELAFEVLPYSRAQNVKQAVSSAYQKIAPFMQKYHVAQLLLSLGMTALLMLALWLADLGLDHILSANQRSTDVILRLAHTINHPSAEWALGWLAFGSVYAVLRVRHTKKLAKPIETRFYSTVNLLLVFVSGALAWYVASAIAFGTGYLWPDKLWGIFDKLLWLHPVIAWLAPLIGLVLAEWQRPDSEDRSFHRGPLRAVSGIVVLMLVGWGGALLIGLPAGLLGGGIGALLHLAGVDNNLGHRFLTVGAGIGFIAAPLAIGLYLLREDLSALRENWVQKQQQDSSPRPNMLAYLIDDEVLPGKPRHYLLAAAVAQRGLLVMAVVILATMIGFKPVVLPVLEFFYGAADDPAFAQTVTSSKWAAAGATALLIAWPVLLISLYQRILSPLLSAHDAAFVRRFSLAAAVLVAIIPVAILLTGRAILDSAPNVDVGLFWTHHAAALVLWISLGVWFALLIRNLPETLREYVDLDFPGGELTIVGIALLAGLIMPGWMWALLLIVIMLIASGLGALQRIE